jgi:hypothetical protein
VVDHAHVPVSALTRANLYEAGTLQPASVLEQLGYYVMPVEQAYCYCREYWMRRRHQQRHNEVAISHRFQLPRSILSVADLRESDERDCAK